MTTQDLIAPVTSDTLTDLKARASAVLDTMTRGERLEALRALQMEADIIGDDDESMAVILVAFLEVHEGRM